MNNRFTYNKGDIDVQNTQCDFCRYNEVNNEGRSKLTCCKYEQKKPDEIYRTLKRCPFFQAKQM